MILIVLVNPSLVSVVVETLVPVHCFVSVIVVTGFSTMTTAGIVVSFGKDVVEVSSSPVYLVVVIDGLGVSTITLINCEYFPRVLV